MIILITDQNKFQNKSLKPVEWISASEKNYLTFLKTNIFFEIITFYVKKCADEKNPKNFYFKHF